MILFFIVAPFFLVGIFFNTHFFWCHWIGFAGLWFLYQKNHGNFLKGFLIPCWLVFFIAYAGGLCWLIRYDFWVYLLGSLAFSLIFPFFFLVYHLTTLKLRSFILKIVAVFTIFGLCEFVLSNAPLTGTAPVDFFFNAPIAILRILRFMNFQTWSAWVFAVCFMAGSFVYFRSRKILTYFVFSLFFMGVLIGLASQYLPSHERHLPIKIALVQHNLPFSEEWRIDHPSEVRAKYEALALEAAKQHPDLIVFPQYTFPGDIYRDSSFFKELAAKAKAHILVASHVPAEEGKSVLDFGFMNLALLFTPEGKLGGIYQATEEAPFGEVPQRLAGKYEVIETPFGRLGVLLCYEDVTPKAAKNAARAGADVLVALSNPGMFTDTPMPYYHLQQDQLRAIETKLPLVRVSPNGYSAFIDRTGRIVQKTRLNSEDILYLNC